MRVRIHRGAREIGGTCIEVEAQGSRIVLDVGLPLDASVDEAERLLPDVPGFREPDDTLLGVFVSHPHVDHYGLARHVLPQVPVYIGADAHRILQAASSYVPGGHAFKNPNLLSNGTPVETGPFRVTPYLMDHSAFDAYALLVEADGKRLYYSGDFRAHGRKAPLFESMVRRPPCGIDVLLMEGTTIGRDGSTEGFPTEADLEWRFVEAFRKTRGLHFVWTSAMNIDRLVTIYRAAKRTNRCLIIDLYTTVVLEATGRTTIPQSHWDGVKLYLPWPQRVHVKKKELFDDLKRHSRRRIFEEHLPDLRGRAVVAFTRGMKSDRGVQSVLGDARFTYSMWSGYLEEEWGRGWSAGWRSETCRGSPSTRRATPPRRTCSGSPPPWHRASWCPSTPSRATASPSSSTTWSGSRTASGGKCRAIRLLTDCPGVPILGTVSSGRGRPHAGQGKHLRRRRARRLHRHGGGGYLAGAALLLHRGPA